MRKKLFGKLLSVALSATMAVTSAVPAYAAMEIVQATSSAGTLKYGEDYEIVSYKNNNKKGTMTVFVQGTSAKFSGFGKFTVKILPKPVKDADK